MRQGGSFGPLELLKDQILQRGGCITSARKKIRTKLGPAIRGNGVWCGKFLADRGCDAQFFEKFARQRLGGRFAGFDFAAGEFPLQRVGVVAPPLANQNFRITDDQCRNNGKSRVLVDSCRCALGVRRRPYRFLFMCRADSACRVDLEFLDRLFPPRKPRSFLRANNSYSVASVMNRASTSKKSRSAARPSLRPNPSVPSAARRRGIHRLIEIRQRLQIVRGRDQHALGIRRGIA